MQMRTARMSGTFVTHLGTCHECSRVRPATPGVTSRIDGSNRGLRLLDDTIGRPDLAPASGPHEPLMTTPAPAHVPGRGLFGKRRREAECGQRAPCTRES